MIQRKRILVCLRAFNDIDNIAPALYYMLLQDKRYFIEVLIYGDDYHYEVDPNLQFLISRFESQIRVSWLGSLLGIKSRYYFSSATMRMAYKLIGKIFPEKSIPRFVTGTRTSDKSIERVLAPLLKNGAAPSLAIFDQNRTQAVVGLTNAIRAFGVKNIIALPVSPFMNISTLRSKDMLDLSNESVKRKHDYSVFDKVGVVHHSYIRSIETAYKAIGEFPLFCSLAEELGSLRYSDDWLKIRSERVFPLKKQKQEVREKKTVLLLLSDPRTNVFWDEVLNAIEIISLNKKYRLVIKPHTRNFAIRLNSDTRFYLDCDTDSSELISESDIVIYWATSVALEGFIQGKFMACLDYVNANHSLYRIYDAGYVMRDRDDLHKLLYSYPSDIESLSYNSEGASSLLRDVIQDEADYPVSDKYLNFIERHLC